jgi:hypothetical protein|tara:strand:- start:375 stop:572 length:198 start_codon:yes stop_codon:yes gene_type:complete
MGEIVCKRTSMTVSDLLLYLRSGYSISYEKKNTAVMVPPRTKPHKAVLALSGLTGGEFVVRRKAS